MFRLQCLLVAAGLLHVSNAQNKTGTHAAVQFLFPNYCVGQHLLNVSFLTLISALF
jgi:hypothetical protein